MDKLDWAARRQLLAAATASQVARFSFPSPLFGNDQNHVLFTNHKAHQDHQERTDCSS